MIIIIIILNQEFNTKNLDCVGLFDQIWLRVQETQQPSLDENSHVAESWSWILTILCSYRILVLRVRSWVE